MLTDMGIKACNMIGATLQGRFIQGTGLVQRRELSPSLGESGKANVSVK